MGIHRVYLHVHGGKESVSIKRFSHFSRCNNRMGNRQLYLCTSHFSFSLRGTITNVSTFSSHKDLELFPLCLAWLILSSLLLICSSVALVSFLESKRGYSTSGYRLVLNSFSESENGMSFHGAEIGGFFFCYRDLNPSYLLFSCYMPRDGT